MYPVDTVTKTLPGWWDCPNSLDGGPLSILPADTICIDCQAHSHTGEGGGGGGYKGLPGGRLLLVSLSVHRYIPNAGRQEAGWVGVEGG